MRTLWFPLLAVAVMLSTSSPSAAQASDSKAVVAALTKQSDAWDKAIVRKDRAAIEANMADDFRSIDGAATVETKRVFVDSLMDATLTIDPYTVEDFDVRLFGDVALLSGRTKMTGRADGKAFASHYRYIDIYAKRNGRWQIVSVQITRVPAE
ncbi:MAG: nuclear transport factor 2 family protein [Vicinamibacteraceae bacterium]